jgi:hypothetical protein
METWDWAGIWWTPAATAGWFTNASATPTESAVLYGLGSGTSTIEQDWYSMPNVTGLNPSYQYQFKFKLASYTFSNSTATTRGVDVADYVSVQVSTNGGVSYVNELRITGNSNATWPYTATGVINHTANGSFTNSAAPAGDVYTSPTGANATGPSTITLNLPMGITQVAVDLYCRANSAGEEWWIDNIELIEIAPITLPIELIEFSGVSTSGRNLLQWSTASEHNNDYFTLERSLNGAEWQKIAIVAAAGNSTQRLDYFYSDVEYARGSFNYYRLTQTDFDGNFESFDVIVIDNRDSSKKLIKIIDITGKEIDINDFIAPGMYIEVYDDGTMKKKWR